MAFNVDIVAAAKANTFFRQVLSTGGEIGEEVHEHVDQGLAFVEGQGAAIR